MNNDETSLGGWSIFGTGRLFPLTAQGDRPDHVNDLALMPREATNNKFKLVNCGP